MYSFMSYTSIGATRQIYKYLMLTSLCVAALSISACDYTQNKTAKFKERPFADNKTLSLEDTRKLAKAATEEDGFRVEEISMTKDGTMRKAKGLKTDQLFSVALSDDKERFIRLENAVQNLHDKINTLDPAIARIMEIDQDLSNITYQLEVLVNERDSISAEQPTMREAQFIPPPSPEINTPPQNIAPASGGQPTPVQAAGPSNTIHNIRIGDHPDKVRIVFETANRAEFLLNFSNDNQTLSIETNNAVIAPDFTGIDNSSNLIQDIQANEDQDLLLLLTASSTKINEGHIAPANNNTYYRYFIDLKK